MTNSNQDHAKSLKPLHWKENIKKDNIKFGFFCRPNCQSSVRWESQSDGDLDVFPGAYHSVGNTHRNRLCHVALLLQPQHVSIIHVQKSYVHIYQV